MMNFECPAHDYDPKMITDLSRKCVQNGTDICLKDSLF